MELWDAYDREGNRLPGVTLVRDEPTPDGMYHIVSDVIVRHKNGDFLLMLRDPNKPIEPGKYELSAGGSALVGEDALACARRELFEETGLACDTFKLLCMLPRDYHHSLLYIFYGETDCDPDAIRLQAGETVGYRWVDAQTLRDMLEGEELSPSTRRRLRGIQSLRNLLNDEIQPEA